MSEKCDRCGRPLPDQYMRGAAPGECYALPSQGYYPADCYSLGYKRMREERDSLRFELDGLEAVRRKDNEYLIGQRDELLGALREFLEFGNAYERHDGRCRCSWCSMAAAARAAIEKVTGTA